MSDLRGRKHQETHYVVQVEKKSRDQGHTRRQLASQGRGRAGSQAASLVPHERLSLEAWCVPVPCSHVLSAMGHGGTSMSPPPALQLQGCHRRNLGV